MEAGDVANLLGHMSANDVRACVADGWAVDALLGHQTLHTKTLTLAVDADQLDGLLCRLTAVGFVPRVDWLLVRIELEDDLGWRVEACIHSVSPRMEALSKPASGAPRFLLSQQRLCHRTHRSQTVDCLSPNSNLRSARAIAVARGTTTTFHFSMDAPSLVNLGPIWAQRHDLTSTDCTI
jgi:hypothetical protein